MTFALADRRTQSSELAMTAADVILVLLCHEANDYYRCYPLHALQAQTSSMSQWASKKKEQVESCSVQHAPAAFG